MFRSPLARAERRSFKQLVLLAFVALVSVYVAQELLEGLVASGHPHGLAAAFGGGGWVAVLLAAPVALLVALGLRGDEALACVTRSRARIANADAAPLLLVALFQAPHSVALALVSARGPPASAVG